MRRDETGQDETSRYNTGQDRTWRDAQTPRKLLRQFKQRQTNGFSIRQSFCTMMSATLAYVPLGQQEAKNTSFLLWRCRTQHANLSPCVPKANVLYTNEEPVVLSVAAGSGSRASVCMPEWVRSVTFALQLSESGICVSKAALAQEANSSVINITVNTARSFYFLPVLKLRTHSLSTLLTRFVSLQNNREGDFTP